MKELVQTIQRYDRKKVVHDRRLKKWTINTSVRCGPSRTCTKWPEGIDLSKPSNEQVISTVSRALSALSFSSFASVQSYVLEAQALVLDLMEAGVACDDRVLTADIVKGLTPAFPRINAHWREPATRFYQEIGDPFAVQLGEQPSTNTAQPSGNPVAQRPKVLQLKELDQYYGGLSKATRNAILKGPKQPWIAKTQELNKGYGKWSAKAGQLLQKKLKRR